MNGMTCDLFYDQYEKSSGKATDLAEQKELGLKHSKLLPSSDSFRHAVSTSSATPKASTDSAFKTQAIAV